MRKDRDGGEKKGGGSGKKRKRQMKIVATMSLPAVDRPNAARLWLSLCASEVLWIPRDYCIRHLTSGIKVGFWQF